MYFIYLQDGRGVSVWLGDVKEGVDQLSLAGGL
jgi:hypothetical protein